MSKGSNRRPMQIAPEEFDQRWAETFSQPERVSAMLDRLPKAYPDFILTERALRTRSGPLVSVTDVIEDDDGG